jgi:RHS repeat-associated protein
VGLADFGARFYKPWIGRFIQPDTIVPDWTNPQMCNG